ncbi:MAG: Ig-like domain-containing protein, partial [Sulfuricaulis sp.]
MDRTNAKDTTRTGITSIRSLFAFIAITASLLSACGGGADGNTSTDTGTAGSSSPTTPTDTTQPSVTITGPVNASSYSTSSATLSLSGSASDNVGVTQVTWVNSRGGSGTASGTTSWNTGSISLQGGSNTLTVTARDAAGNTRTDSLVVTYSTTTPGDTTAPGVTISSPTSSAAYTTSSGTLSLGGSASDNVGVTQVTWSNNRGGSGTAGGTTSWSVGSIT